MKLLSCNVRVSGAKDGDNSWPFRKEICAQQIAKQNAGIVCFQEMTATQFEFLSNALPEYKSYGIAEDAIGKNPVNCIFYRPDLFTLIFASGYWLSETPHIPTTKSWESQYVRLANWVRLKENKTGVEFRLINTHLDNVGLLARENQARLIVEDCQAYPKEYPQILTGDMNEDFTYNAIKTFKAGGWTDTYHLIHQTENPGHTYHGYEGEKHQAIMGKIDWIFTRGKIKTLDAEIIKESVNGKYPSDHYFISAKVEL